MAERVISVEIGRRITRVCETEYKGKGEIFQHFFFETPEDVLFGQSVGKSEAFRQLLKENLEQRGIKTKKVVFAFNAMGIGSKEEVVPVMKENRLRDYIKTNTTRFFPVNPEEYQIVYRVNGPEGEDKQRVQMYAISLETVQSYDELAAFCDLTLVDLELVENGIAQALRKAFVQGTVVNISVEEQSSSITIISDGDIALQRNLSYGVEEAVLAFQENEKVENYGQAWDMMAKNCYVHKGFEYTRGEDRTKDDVTEELRYVVNNISRILEYYVSKHQGVTLDTILLTGIGSGCQGLQELIAAEIGYEISSVDASLIPNVEQLSDISRGNAMLSTVTAVGSPIGINLSPVKKARMAQGLENLSTAKKFFVGCVVICALMMIFPAVRMGILAVKQNGLEKSIQSMAQAKKVNDAYLSTKQNYEELLHMVEMTETPNDALLSLLGEMENSLPTEAVIQEMTADAESVKISFIVPNKKVAAKTIEVFRSFEQVRDISTDDLHQVTEDEQMSNVFVFVITCYYEGAEIATDNAPAEETAELEEDLE